MRKKLLNKNHQAIIKTHFSAESSTANVLKNQKIVKKFTKISKIIVLSRLAEMRFFK